MKKGLSRTKKYKSKKKAQAFFFISIAIGILLTLYGSYKYVSYQETKLSFDTIPTPQKVLGSIPVKITIPRIKIDLPIQEASINDGIWQVSPTQASHLSSSTRPGEEGNMVIYGHNKTNIFGSLPYGRIGDEIKMVTEDGKAYNYTIFNKVQVKPSNIQYVLPTKTEILTIYTCVGLFDSERLILQASPSAISI